MDDAPAQPPPPPPPLRPPSTAPTPALREFTRKRKKTGLSDLIVPLVTIGLAMTLFYLLSQRQLVANIFALNDGPQPLTVQVNLERLRVNPGKSGTFQVYHVSGESMDLLAGGGTLESIRLPDVTPAWVIYNTQGKSSAVVVDYSWAYGADGRRSANGPQFKVLANLQEHRIFTFGEATVLGPDEPLPASYTGGKPLLKVVRVPQLELKTPENYLRDNMQ